MGQASKFVNFHGEMSPKQFEIGRALDDVLETMHRIEQQQTVIQETRPSSDWQCLRPASDEELQANDILQILKRMDVEKARNVGNHFLETRDLLGQSDLLQIMQHMPKGGQLHVHFNACLAPEDLLDIAASMKRMFITSDRALLTEDDYNQSEIQFQILSEEKEGLENLFERHKMRFQDFLHKFPREKMGYSAMQWLIIWRMFNIRTRMMKGLFNYETAFKRYMRLFLEELQDEGFQYAEIRPNFMNTNQLWSDDGNRQFTNQEMMEIIIHEYEEFQQRSDQALGGLKVIYCTPRSFSKENVKASLKECLDFKLRWPKWIAGFDLVGKESKGHKLKYFLNEFMEFRVECREKNIDIPFLFHCGETKDDPDGNLLTALALGAKRVAHGFALPQRPVVMKQMIERGTLTLTRDFYEVFLHTEDDGADVDKYCRQLPEQWCPMVIIIGSMQPRDDNSLDPSEPRRFTVDSSMYGASKTGPVYFSVACFLENTKRWQRVKTPPSGAFLCVTAKVAGRTTDTNHLALRVLDLAYPPRPASAVAPLLTLNNYPTCQTAMGNMP
ncbi:hypothetical protein DL766_009512 [Monosporascus sp. MC13-8B]|uniref:Adenosine deaminase domain-containing protein n=1 Tax=Monosporascus cannonballus TaxID=155416 RepID=A0ABY0GVX8_9PEZI|nr:hypothetical protein DL762_008769 [Monosporascus cannonballus]RYO84149.1 hypothetical protein DL763_007578 [Monosporascus cannonballus]RYP15039.1 hypothetical protein DL766_009512 [Monosporascus sp. MC13-8B]